MQCGKLVTNWACEQKEVFHIRRFLPGSEPFPIVHPRTPPIPLLKRKRALGDVLEILT